MATTAQLNEWLAAGVVTTAGAAVASGVVRFYLPGTLTPRTVYSDAAAASPISQPVVLSAGGVAVVYTTAPCRMIVKDASDTSTLYDVTENVTRADQVFVTSSAINAGAETALSTIWNAWSASGGGGGLGIFTYRRSGASAERNLFDAIGESRVSVKDWGAVGNGVADDTAAINAALNQMFAAGGGTVFFPAGTYLISSALSIQAKVSVVGAGSAQVIIKLNNAAANAFTLSASGGVGNNSVTGIQIIHATTTTGTGIACSATSRIYMRDVVMGLNQFKKGVTFDACSNTSVYDCFIYGNDSGAGTGRAIHYTTSGNTHSVIGGEIGVNNSGAAIECDTGTNGFLFLGVNFFSASIGLKLTSSSNDDLIRMIGCPGLNANTVTPFSETASPASRGLHQTGNFIEGYTVDVAAAGNHTPSPLLRGPNIRIRATSAGTITVNALTTNPIVKGYRMILHFYNNGGGAITWSLAALYHVSTTIPNTDGHHIMVEFAWDTDAACFREVTRADTV